jgi:hypothetical protein
METTTMFVCERCKVLLMKLIMRYTDDEPAEFDENGEYSWSGNGESELDYYLCPICGGRSCSGHAEDDTLKEIEIPTEFFKALSKIWNEAIASEAQQPNIDIQVVVSYGIPLSNERLKELLVEYLV